MLAVGVGLFFCVRGGGVFEGFGVVCEFQRELVHFLGVRPRTLGLEQEQLQAKMI